MNNVTSWLAIPTFFTALFLAILAWRQWKIAERKLKLDLYDRRFKFYAAVRAFILHIRSSGAVTQSAIDEYIRATADSEFLFNAEIPAYIEHVLQKALDARYAHDQVKDYPPSELQADLLKKAYKMIHSFETEYNEITKLFHPYLGFGKLRAMKLD